MDANTESKIVDLPGAEMEQRIAQIRAKLKPKSAVGGHLRRVGRDQDGGYVMLSEAIKKQCPVYSLGVGYEASFDLQLAEEGHPVFQYDHTVDGPPVRHKNFNFHKQAIDTGDGRLRKIIGRNLHWFRHDMLLNMDIESHEYQVIPSTPASVLDQFAQIVIELHWFTKIADDGYYKSALATVEALTRSHQVIHVHGNNWGWLGRFGSTIFPDSVEVTLVRRKDFSFEPCNAEFPTALDRPCKPDAPDYYLGRLGAVA